MPYAPGAQAHQVLVANGRSAEHGGGLSEDRRSIEQPTTATRSILAAKETL